MINFKIYIDTENKLTQVQKIVAHYNSSNVEIIVEKLTTQPLMLGRFISKNQSDLVGVILFTTEMKENEFIKDLSTKMDQIWYLEESHFEKELHDKISTYFKMESKYVESEQQDKEYEVVETLEDSQIVQEDIDITTWYQDEEEDISYKDIINNDLEVKGLTLDPPFEETREVEGLDVSKEAVVVEENLNKVNTQLLQKDVLKGTEISSYPSFLINQYQQLVINNQQLKESYVSLSDIKIKLESENTNLNIQLKLLQEKLDTVVLELDKVQKEKLEMKTTRTLLDKKLPTTFDGTNLTLHLVISDKIMREFYFELLKEVEDKRGVLVLDTHPMSEIDTFQSFVRLNSVGNPNKWIEQDYEVDKVLCSVSQKEFKAKIISSVRSPLKEVGLHSVPLGKLEQLLDNTKVEWVVPLYYEEKSLSYFVQLLKQFVKAKVYYIDNKLGKRSKLIFENYLNKVPGGVLISHNIEFIPIKVGNK